MDKRELMNALNILRDNCLATWKAYLELENLINSLPPDETSKVITNKKSKEDCSMHSEKCNKKSCSDCFHALSLI